jgi:hypothetical protein
MAEREGFEPSVPLRVLTLSKRTRSAAPAPLQTTESGIQDPESGEQGE